MPRKKVARRAARREPSDGRDKEASNSHNMERSVHEVFEEFLDDCRARLPEKAARQYEKQLDNFKNSLERHDESAHSLEMVMAITYIPEFLMYYMVRKVTGVTKKHLKGAVTVMKNLVQWLQRKEYIGVFGTKAAERLEKCGEHLEMAEDTFERIAEYAPSPDGVHSRNYMMNSLDAALSGKSIALPPGNLPNGIFPDEEDQRRGIFSIEDIKPGKLYVQKESHSHGTPTGEVLIVNVPEEVSSHCHKGWTLEARLEKDSRNWKIKEIWTIYVMGAFGGDGMFFFMEKGDHE
eukprot:gb/GECG01010526.1/.p1 GENE.gb/GECG01010526.1/~~gb/GECG01010526.1/.p1  ORF type:complete len:292 (+),score=43.39 gb/GECG01010526.1/:1-876(+)